ncbi:SOS response-associated peptidase [Conexibacter sp. DBS9H8]|uniref:SOS response-associated peptidase n=1 Tax=Conexibacter sp. DBS9H8 TaxID=2937801 RepID=UPI00200CD386|nr:SOS response-associated peptidase [Conexibacter sp. DBS9H8]
MCGRYSLAGPDPAELRTRFGLREAPEWTPRYNLAPGEAILTVTAGPDGAREVARRRWGLVPPFLEQPPRSGALFNARAETAAEKPLFRAAFARSRCLIPADGFYEWARLPDEPIPGAPGRPPRRPFHVSAADGAILAFAGLAALWRPGTAEAIASTTILTTVANATVAAVHHRMPVILTPEQELEWLDPTTPVGRLRELISGEATPTLSLVAVNPAVNDARHDGPDCLTPPPPGPPTSRSRARGPVAVAPTLF